MAKVLIFLLGVLTGLAFAKIPRYTVFNDKPPTPDDWVPKMRHWVNGKEVA